MYWDYLPILKWKQGERIAVRHVTDKQWKCMTVAFELMPAGIPTSELRSRLAGRTKSVKKIDIKPEIKKAREKKSKSEPRVVLEKLLERADEELDKEDLRMTVSDLIRLLQWRKEVEQEDEQPREIEVRWVDEPVTKETDS